MKRKGCSRDNVSIASPFLYYLPDNPEITDTGHGCICRNGAPPGARPDLPTGRTCIDPHALDHCPKTFAATSNPSLSGISNCGGSATTAVS